MSAASDNGSAGAAGGPVATQQQQSQAQPAAFSLQPRPLQLQPQPLASQPVAAAAPGAQSAAQPAFYTQNAAVASAAPAAFAFSLQPKPLQFQPQPLASQAAPAPAPAPAAAPVHSSPAVASVGVSATPVAAPSSASTPSSASVPPCPHVCADLPVVDDVSALEQCQEWAFFVELLDDMFKEREEVESKMAACIATNDHLQFGKEAHALKGAALNLHLPALSDLTKKAEIIGKQLAATPDQEEYLQARHTMLAQLRIEYDRLLAVLPEYRQRAEEAEEGGDDAYAYEDDEEVHEPNFQ